MSIARRTTSCYWAVIDLERAGLAGLPKRPSASTRRTLGYLAESQIPIKIEELHYTIASLDNRTAVVCLVDKHIARDARDAGSDSLKPATGPRGHDVDVDAIELLHGPFEPKMRQHRRRRRWTSAFVSLSLVFAVVSFGLVRRAADINATAEQLRSDAMAAVDAALAGEGNPRLSANTRLTQTLRRLRQTRAGDANIDTAAINAAEALSAALAPWPKGTTAQTSSVEIDATRAVFAVTFLDDEDPERLLAAYREDPRWSLGEQTFDQTRTRSGMQPRLRFTVNPNTADEVRP